MGGNADMKKLYKAIGIVYVCILVGLILLDPKTGFAVDIMLLVFAIPYVIFGKILWKRYDKSLRFNHRKPL